MMKAVFLCKRMPADVQPAVALLSSRVTELAEQDWKKPARVLDFLKSTIEDVLTLEADDTSTLKWRDDMSFAAHDNMKEPHMISFHSRKRMDIF